MEEKTVGEVEGKRTILRDKDRGERGGDRENEVSPVNDKKYKVYSYVSLLFFTWDFSLSL